MDSGSVVYSGHAAGALRAKLFLKINKIQQELSAIGKHGRNDFHKYSYATAESVFEALRPLCAKHGLAIIPGVTEYEQERGEKALHSVCTYQFSICDAETGLEYVTSWVSEAIDKGDKGLNKCHTAAYKYFLMRFFMVPTDEPDPDSESPVSPKKPGNTKKPSDAVWEALGEA